MHPIFTDPLVDLYPDTVKDSGPSPSSSYVLCLTSSPAVGSPDPDPAPLAPSKSSIDHLLRSHRVRAPPSQLIDFHCYFAFIILHKPHTYSEASTNPLWQ